MSTERDLQDYLSEERARLETEAGLRFDHYQRPKEKRLSAGERFSTTILFGGLNWRHDKLIKGVFEASNYQCQNLPTPDAEAYEIGYRYCSSGQCNPVYFTAGSLLKYLFELEGRGLSRSQIVDSYVFLLGRACGPCRFGLYEADYRKALDSAGFRGFRLVPFQLKKGINQEEADGLKYSVDFGMGLFQALHLGDLFRDLAFQIRPFEVVAGQTDQVFGECLDILEDYLRDFQSFEMQETIPRWIHMRLDARSFPYRLCNSLGKIYRHLYGDSLGEVLEQCRRKINQIAVDRLRVKPIVKLTGELFAHLTEGAGNYNMFSFLEKEGAQVFPDGIGALLMHLLYQNRSRRILLSEVHDGSLDPKFWQLGKPLRRRVNLWKGTIPLALATRIYEHQYHRRIESLGSVAHGMVSQRELAELSRPFYHPLLRGGEAHLEVAKTIHYGTRGLCHMILSMKPFGCMPSVQSDGVQSAVLEKYPDLIFLSVETAGDGSVLAESRVQMALSEARQKSLEEFDRALEASGQTLEEIRNFVERRPALKKPLYNVPRSPGIAGAAANFVIHVGKLMSGESNQRS